MKTYKTEMRQSYGIRFLNLEIEVLGKKGYKLISIVYDPAPGTRECWFAFLQKEIK